MRILGIDPGYAIVGYGIVEYDGFRFDTVAYGAITTPTDKTFPERLKMIYDDLSFIIKKYHPEHLSIEKLYFNTNTTTAIDVAQARGAILLCATENDMPIFEYTPLQVKQAITGYGRAEKQQVMEMIKRFLSLNAIPKPDDTADALAVAVCHGHSVGNLVGKLNVEAKKK